MGKEDISIKFLIHLVGERPALWDKTSDDYKDRALKQTSWREICACVNENYYGMAPRAKDEFTRMIIKKWTHIRDSWVKSMKHGYDQNTITPPKPYVYHNELKFMQKILKCKPARYNLNSCQLSKIFEEFYREKNETQNSNGTSQDMDNDEKEENLEADGRICAENLKHEPITSNAEESITVNKTRDSDDADDWHLEDTEIEPIAEEQNETTGPAKKKRSSIFVSTRHEEPTTVATATPPMVSPHHSLYGNRHWSFFKGILPSLTGLDEDHVLRFQSGVIVLLQNLRQSQKQKSDHPNRVSSHSLFKGRGRKRKASLDGEEFSTRNFSFRRRPIRQIYDPIGSENENSENEYFTDN